MARNSAALRVVNDEVDEPTGDVSLTREAMSEWKEGQRRCRARKRHNWAPYTVWEYRYHYDVVEQCSHCRNRRHADFSKAGRKLTNWKADYRDGYLLPKGAMRIVDELQDELWLGDILSRRIVEASDDEEKHKDSD
jgi:hypothetical protein